MPSDTDAIRDLVATWLRASKAGDLQTVLELMTDDAVFLVPGRDPMTKARFAASGARDPGGPEIDAVSEIEEVQVAGDWAYLWTKLRIVITPRDGTPPSRRADHTLSILRRENGRWRLARDANLLAPIAEA